LKLKFEYYLHDNYTSFERAEYIGEEIGIKFTEEMTEDMGGPFYEVGLECEYDTETGQVTILGLMT
jgi:hypothetical protein